MRIIHKEDRNAGRFPPTNFSSLHAFLIIFMFLFFAVPAFAAGYTSSAQDDLAQLVAKAGVLKNGMTIGADSRSVEVLSVKEFTVSVAVATPAATTPVAAAVLPSNLALNKTATSSTPCGTTEGAEKAFNGSVSGGWSDKWCSGASSKFLQVDLGSVANLTEFVVSHASAGNEGTAYNTKDFDISVSVDGTTWTNAVTVTGNTLGVTTHTTTAKARYVKLNVTTPTQTTTDKAARIYEFAVKGSPVVPAALTVSPAEISVNTAGKLTATVTNQTVKLAGVVFKTGDVIQLKFTSSQGSWSTAMNVGSNIQFTTALPQSPVSLAVSGSSAAGTSGADISMSSIGVTYKGVEFMTKCDWSVSADVTSGGIPAGTGSFKFSILPGSAVGE